MLALNAVAGRMKPPPVGATRRPTVQRSPFLDAYTGDGREYSLPKPLLWDLTSMNALHPGPRFLGVTIAAWWAHPFPRAAPGVSLTADWRVVCSRPGGSPLSLHLEGN